MPICLNESMKKENVLAVFEAVADSSCATRSEIADETGLSTVTVGKAAEALVDADILRLTISQKKGVGRKAERLSINRERVFIVMDISGYYMEMFVYNLSFEDLDKRSFREIPDFSYHDNLRIFMHRVKNYMLQNPQYSYWATVLVVPGHYDRAKDAVLDAHCGFNELKLRQYIQRVIGMPPDIIIDSSSACMRYCQSLSAPNENILLVTAYGAITAQLSMGGAEYPGGRYTAAIDDSGMQHQIAEMVAFILSTVPIDAVYIQTESCREWVREKEMEALLRQMLVRNPGLPRIVTTNNRSFAPVGAAIILRKAILMSRMK